MVNASLPAYPAVPSASDIRDRCERAYEAFVTNELDLISRNPSERALTHRLAIYIEQLSPSWAVDCECNRLGQKQPKTVEVAAPDAVSPFDDDAVTVFPDIVVHRRDLSGPNLLVIEAKKATSRADHEFDYIKVKAYRQQREYQCAAFIVLPAGDRERRPIEWIAAEA